MADAGHLGIVPTTSPALRPGTYGGAMDIDVDAAKAFLATHGRLVDRARLDLVLGDGDGDTVLRALDGYRNADGGYGRGLEPDLRARESQPAAAMHALEVVAETGAPDHLPARTLCDWLERHTLPGGALPFALPIADPTGCSPFWVEADPTAPSLMMTAQVAANAHRVGRQDRAVAEHPWLARATAYCLETIAAVDAAPHAYELMFSIRFLDAAGRAGVEVDGLLDRLGGHLPADGRLPVAGGTEDEALHPLDLSPDADAPSRRLLADEVVAADRRRLAAGQQPDGGWTVDFDSHSPAAALEWRGYATVAAIARLR